MISIDTNESFYSDYSVKGDKVYIYCTVFIKNNSQNEKNVMLNALFDNDVETGLLKESVLKGYDIDRQTEVFELIKGVNKLEVVFIGEFAGTAQKHDRLLPQIKIIEQ